ncbi:MAG TPA: hypothetical protein VIJ07_17390 [Dermatophilaceae bacterium]
MYQILEVVLRAVPRQSLRARPKWLVLPGPSVAAVEALAGAIGTNIAAATTVAAAKGTVAVLILISDGSLSGAEHLTTVTDCPNILPTARVVKRFATFPRTGAGRHRTTRSPPIAGLLPLQEVAAGKTRMKARRCLKRRIPDALYRQLLADARASW